MKHFIKMCHKTTKHLYKTKQKGQTEEENGQD